MEWRPAIKQSEVGMKRSLMRLKWKVKSSLLRNNNWWNQLKGDGRWSCKLITNNFTNSMRGLLSFVCCCFLALRSLFLLFAFVSFLQQKREGEIERHCAALLVFFLGLLPMALCAHNPQPIQEEESSSIPIHAASAAANFFSSSFPF